MTAEPKDRLFIPQTLDELYKHLSPLDTFSQLNASKSINAESLSQLIHEQILSSTGKTYSWATFVDKINEYFKKSKKSNSSNSDFLKKEEAKELFKDFHAKSTDYKKNIIIGVDGFTSGDADYWGKTDSGSPVITLTPIAPDLAKAQKSHRKCTVSAFVSRNPYISPATRAAGDVEVFLNYMPTLAASQMVPYLDVEFELLGQLNSKFVTTPHYMRFLLGSVDSESSSLSADDKTLFKLDIVEERQEKITAGAKKVVGYNKRNIVRSGVETFLLPATLTNMDNLSAGPGRLLPASPFVPFASLEGFDVQVRNAGAGAMIRKTANLKIKIHDKKRLSEFSEFLRGPSGYSQALIWTRYGWSAPEYRDGDAYSNFINEKMYMEDCWQVSNVSFSFDQVGQTSISLQLTSRSAPDIEKLMVSAGSDSTNDTLNKLNKTIETIGYYYDLLRRNETFSVDITVQEILNAGSSSGNLGKFKNLDQITKKIQALSERMGFSAAQATELKKSLDDLSSQGENLYSRYRGSIPDAVKQKFNNLAKGPDPFLPKQDSKYFPDADLHTAIANFTKDSDSRNKTIIEDLKKAEESKDPDKDPIKPITLDKSVEVVSFGKLFLNFAASAFVSLEKVDEVQLFFYPLNDSCGPLSGYSIAEFPIDSVALAYSYTEQLKALSTNELTLQQFLRLVIDSQFSDVRAIGYGRNRFYKPAVPGKTGPAEKMTGKDAAERKIESDDLEWTSKYGAWRPPMIDMFIETGEEEEPLKIDPKDPTVGGVSVRSVESSIRKRRRRGDRRNYQDTGTIVMRIHIYDRQHDPHRMVKSILTGDSGAFERGVINRGRVRSYLQQSFDKVSEKQRQQFVDQVKKTLSEIDNNESYKDPKQKEAAKVKALRDSIQKATNGSGGLPPQAVAIDRPNRVDYKIKDFGNKRDVVKAELMRFVPTITPGTNGSLIKTINLGSNADGAMGAANLHKVVKGGTGKNALSSNGLSENNDLPLRVVPVQLTMTTVGCPIAQNYQQYFIDLNTGTTIDNLYRCVSLSHTMSPGRFESSWTFAYTDGYGRFGHPPSLDSVVLGEAQDLLRKMTQELEDKKSFKGGGTPAKAAQEPAKDEKNFITKTWQLNKTNGNYPANYSENEFKNKAQPSEIAGYRNFSYNSKTGQVTYQVPVGTPQPSNSVEQ